MDDLKHFIVCDSAVFVNIVQLECPFRGDQYGKCKRTGRTFEFFIQLASACDAEGADKLFEIDGPILVLVKNIEDVVGKLGRVTKRKELLVYSTELGPV